MRLEGKVALITGTASGIGRASALRFAEEGARIVAADIAEANHETVELIRAGGGEATAVHADVSDDADMALAVKTAEATYGSLDIAFNNAGIMMADDADAVATTTETIDRTLAVNLKGVLYGCRHQIPAMRRAGAGVHHQHGVLRGVGGGGHSPDRLHRLQGGRAVADARTGGHPRPREHPGQCSVTGAAPHGVAHGLSRHRREAAAPARACADGTLRRGHRDGLSRTIPRI